MLILGMDTSTPRLALGLRLCGETLAVRHVRPESRPAEIILDELDALLRKAGVGMDAVQGIAVGLGPGSFTGLRVGAATAQGLAQARGIPLAGVSSFRTMAAAAGDGPVLVVEDARRGQWYGAVYRRAPACERPILQEGLYDAGTLTARLPSDTACVTGPGAHLFSAELETAGIEIPRILTGEAAYPSADVLIGLAEDPLRRGGETPENLVPNYIRRTQAEETRRARAGERSS